MSNQPVHAGLGAPAPEMVPMQPHHHHQHQQPHYHQQPMGAVPQGVVPLQLVPQQQQIAPQQHPLAGLPPEAYYYSAMGEALGTFDQYGRPVPFGQQLGQAPNPTPAPAPAAAAPAPKIQQAETGAWWIPLLLLGGGIWVISEMVGSRPAPIPHTGTGI